MRGLAAFFALAIAVTLPAQSPKDAPARPSFDAASVKPGGPFYSGSLGMRGGPGTDDPGRITFPRTLLKPVLMKAYGVKFDEISAPPWIDDYSAGDANYFSITATMQPGTTPQQFQLMLQKFLVERFHLVVHRETRDFPGYELVVAPGGVKLREAGPEDAFDPSKPFAPPAPDGFPVRRPGSPGGTSMPRPGTWGMIRSTNRESMADLARSLGSLVNVSNGAEQGIMIPRVVDKTGLSGVYEFRLEFAGMSLPPASLRAASPGLSGDVAEASDPGQIGPNLFTALEKQLGLKLQKVKSVPVEILVVDHIDKVPTEN